MSTLWIRDRWFLLLSCFLAQSTRVEVFGVVRDPAVLPVPGAAVEIRNVDSGASAATQTGTGGVYRFVGLSAGNYELNVRKDGFAALRRGGLTLRVGDQVALDLVLTLGDVSQSVQVTGTAPLLQAARGTASFTVEQEKVVALPLDGRNFVPLIALSPGVMLPPASTLPRINGSRPRVSEYIYDGISVDRKSVV